MLQCQQKRSKGQLCKIGTIVYVQTIQIVSDLCIGTGKRSLGFSMLFEFQRGNQIRLPKGVQVALQPFLLGCDLS